MPHFNVFITEPVFCGPGPRSLFLTLSGTGPVRGLIPEGLRTGTGPDLEALVDGP